MGDDAALQGSLRPGLVDHGAKRLQVRNWTAAADSFTWQIDVPRATEFEVVALTKSRGAVLELSCGGTKLERDVTTGWDRIAMGQLSVPSGVHSITLRAPRPGRRMEFYSLELTTPDLARTLEREARARRADTTCMRRVKYGVQFHWTSRSAPRQGDRKPYAEAVRDFPAREFAALVHSMGAGYVILTTSHAEHFFPAPIRAIDRIKPRRTADRDLVRDWIDALGAYGIKLILYYHVGHDDWRQPDGWWQATGFDPRRPQRFLENWRAIVSEVGTRYRDGLAGWFFDDGCVYYPLNPDFRQLTEVAKTGNPDRLVCYNPWALRA